MKKKIILIFCIVFFITSVGMVVGSKSLRKRVSNYYKNHFSVVRFLFKDRYVFANAKALSSEKEKERDLWDQYYERSLKLNAKRQIVTPTGYFFKQSTHPDVLYFKEGFNGYKYWMAFTPYPNSKDRYENPHIIAGNTVMNMRVPRGVKNPIVPPPDDVDEGGHLSDTDISYNNGKFSLHYVYNKKGVSGPSKFYRVQSKDGIKWDKPELIYESKETVEGYSPAVIYEGNKARMWFVGGEGNMVVTESIDDEKTWGKVDKCNIEMNGWRPWHVDIIKTDRKYEGLLCAKAPSINTRALFYIDSVDGINWRTSNDPIIFPNKDGWDNSEIYRATFVKDVGEYRIWYSARSGSKKWYIGHTKVQENVIENLKMN